ncbi:hypothetical protein QTP88_017784 [Uroleucon formosanum]
MYEMCIQILTKIEKELKNMFSFNPNFYGLSTSQFSFHHEYYFASSKNNISDAISLLTIITLLTGYSPRKFIFHTYLTNTKLNYADANNQSEVLEHFKQPVPKLRPYWCSMTFNSTSTPFLIKWVLTNN